MRPPMPRLGLGTWEMGVSRAARIDEIEALRLGIDLGMSLIDTAEMYGDGGAEEVVGEALEGRRDEVFVVSKVLPGNASFEGTVLACERSLRRLRTDRLDLYLLHWAGPHPIEGTLEAFERLREAGKILRFGVSNFDVHEMREVCALPAGAGVAANQVLYNLGRRSIERKLLPWCAARGITVMAYSPLEQGRLRPRPALQAVAARHGISTAQVALAWTLRDPGVVTIPKAARPDHVRENAAVVQVTLTERDLAELDRDYPVPDRDTPLEML